MSGAEEGEHFCRMEYTFSRCCGDAGQGKLKFPQLNVIVWGMIVASHFFIAADLVAADNELLRSLSRFMNPRLVEIYGLPAGAGKTGISTEEPFVSRDGRFLFFNSGKNENNKDLHYAEWINHKWVYRGSMGPMVNNAKEVQANPTMDGNYNFFYLDTAVKSMIRMAKFSPDTGKLHSLRDLEGIPTKKVKFIAQKVSGNMGVEISADGSYLFFSRATWELKITLKGFTVGKLLDADILFARQKGRKYIYHEAESKRIMRRVNTSDLEYAASISSDGLELFFTRLLRADYQTGKIRSRIMRCTRNSLAEPFGKPEMIAALGHCDFVEGPAISGDGKALYYHKLVGQKFRIYKVSR